MALDSSYKMENVITSLDKWMFDNVASPEGILMDWEGGDSVDLKNVDEWIQPRIMAGVADYVHQVCGNRIGQNTHFLYNINIFVKRGVTTSKNRLQQLRDIVADNYTIGTSIPFMDYASSDTQIGEFVVRDIMTDMQIPPAAARIEMESTYFQYTLTPDIVVIQKWSG